MESLSSVSTIMGIVQDILAAVETARENKSRCKKIGKRVRCLKDILEAAAATEAEAAATDAAATRRVMVRLEEALGDALLVVRRCQRSSFAIVASGRMAESLDGVEKEIDQCILDLTLANSLRIARVETLVRQQQHTMAAAAASTEADSGEKDDENKRKKKGHDNTAIGVPVCTPATAAVHKHEMVAVPPPSSYGYCCSCRSYHQSYYCCCRNHGWAAGDGDAGGPSNAAFYHTQYYSRYPSMFSDDDPNSCSIL